MISVTPYKAGNGVIIDARGVVSKCMAPVQIGTALGVRDYHVTSKGIATTSFDKSAVILGAKVLWQMSGNPRPDMNHLNGCAFDGDDLLYVSHCGDDWRNLKGQGVVIDCAVDEIVCGGLRMPHSPRLAAGDLWICNSGDHAFGVVRAGRFEEIARFGGFPRGVCIEGSTAHVGVSRIRGADVICGIQQVNIETGAMGCFTDLSAYMREIYVLEIVQ